MQIRLPSWGSDHHITMQEEKKTHKSSINDMAELAVFICVCELEIISVY